MPIDCFGGWPGGLDLGAPIQSPRRRGPRWISAWQSVTAPTIEDFHDARKQGGSNDGVTFVREMHKVKGTIAQRHLLIVHNHAH